MINKIYYQDLGLVNTSGMFRQAMDEGFAVPAYNFNNMEQLQGIITGCVESKSPVILQVSGSARKYAHAAMLPHLAVGAVAMAEDLGHGPHGQVRQHGCLRIFAGAAGNLQDNRRFGFHAAGDDAL